MHRVRFAEIELTVASLDLSRSPEDLLSQIDGTADEIRRRVVILNSGETSRSV